MCIHSPTTRPKAAPILNTGMKLPLGTGIVELIMENMNCKVILNQLLLFVSFYSD